MNRAQKLIKLSEEFLDGKDENYVHNTLKTEATAHSYEKDIREPAFQSMAHYGDYGYRDMNARLRGQKRKISNPHEKLTVPKLISHFKTLTKNPTQHDFTVYRSVVHTPGFKPLKKGDVFQDKGFTSTSTDPKVTKTFTVGAQSSRYKIHVPEGTKGYYLSGHPKKMLMSEREFVLHPGTKFRVGEDATDDHGDYTNLHIHSQED